MAVSVVRWRIPRDRRVMHLEMRPAFCHVTGHGPAAPSDWHLGDASLYNLPPRSFGGKRNSIVEISVSRFFIFFFGVSRVTFFFLA